MPIYQYFREGDSIKSKVKKPRIPSMKKAKMAKSTADFWKKRTKKLTDTAAKKAKRKAAVKSFIHKSLSKFR